MENKSADLEDIKDTIQYIDQVYHLHKNQLLPLLISSIYNEFWQKLALVMVRFELEGDELEQLEQELDGEIFLVLEKILTENKSGKEKRCRQESAKKIKEWSGKGFKKLKKLIRDIHLNDFLQVVHISERRRSQGDYETIKHGLLSDIDVILDSVEDQEIKNPSQFLKQLEKELADVEGIATIRKNVTDYLEKRQEIIRQINEAKT